MECRDCQAYDLDKQHCHRFPSVVEKGLSDWCMEFKAKEVVVHAEGIREDAGQLPETRVVEEVSPIESGKDLEQQAPEEPGRSWQEIRKRGWPKGKPRK